MSSTMMRRPTLNTSSPFDVHEYMAKEAYGDEYMAKEAYRDLNTSSPFDVHDATADVVHKAA